MESAHVLPDGSMALSISLFSWSDAWQLCIPASSIKPVNVEVRCSFNIERGYVLSFTGMICGDAEITIGSTIAALALPCASKSTINRVFVPKFATHSVISGAKLGRASKYVSTTFYQDFDEIASEIANFDGKRTHLTIYLQTVTDGSVLDLKLLLKTIAPKLQKHGKLASATFMFDDRNGLGKIGPQSLGYLNLMEARHGNGFLRSLFNQLGCRVQVVVAGSWFDAFGHQGGYVIGSAGVVECLTWDAKAFFFSTPPMPLQAAMSDRMLELLAERPLRLEHEDLGDGAERYRGKTGKV
jgi:serine palmitoyltransferase